MRLESSLVHIDLVQPDSVRVFRILYHVEPDAARLVIHRANRVPDHLFDELILVAFFNLNGSYDYVHLLLS